MRTTPFLAKNMTVLVKIRLHGPVFGDVLEGPQKAPKTMERRQKRLPWSLLCVKGNFI
jgi:hypothetical protein